MKSERLYPPVSGNWCFTFSYIKDDGSQGKYVICEKMRYQHEARMIASEKFRKLYKTLRQ